jgi:hypothetical protein
MDAARVGNGHQTSKMSTMTLPAIKISDDESEVDAILTVHPRVNGINGTHDLDALDGSEAEYDSEDEWDNESLMHDTIEEMGDEHLFEGGLLPSPLSSMTR